MPDLKPLPVEAVSRRCLIEGLSVGRSDGGHSEVLSLPGPDSCERISRCQHDRAGHARPLDGYGLVCSADFSAPTRTLALILSHSPRPDAGQ